jgi:hypothetical protein
VNREGLLAATVANNALWCDAICRSHGYPGVFSARFWISAHYDLTFYPNVITCARCHRSGDSTGPE